MTGHGAYAHFPRRQRPRYDTKPGGSSREGSGGILSLAHLGGSLPILTLSLGREPCLDTQEVMVILDGYWGEAGIKNNRGPRGERRFSSEFQVCATLENVFILSSPSTTHLRKALKLLLPRSFLRPKASNPPHTPSYQFASGCTAVQRLVSVRDQTFLFAHILLCASLGTITANRASTWWNSKQ